MIIVSGSRRETTRIRGVDMGEHIRLLGDTNQWALFDAAALEQAIGHLLQNAVEACSPALPVTVRVGNTEAVFKPE